MGYDPEPPTRRIPPQPPAGTPVAQSQHIEREVVTEDDLRHQQLLDKLRSLQTALALVGVLAAAALGVALYAVLSSDEEGDGRGASSSRVSQLEEDVDRLNERVEDRATENSVSELRQDVEELNGDVEQAQSEGGGAEEATQAVEDLRGDVDQLEQQVEDLAQQAEAQPSEEGTTTTP